MFHQFGFGNNTHNVTFSESITNLDQGSEMPFLVPGEGKCLGATFEEQITPAHQTGQRFLQTIVDRPHNPGTQLGGQDLARSLDSLAHL